MALQGAYARNKERRNRNVNAMVDQTLFGGGPSAPMSQSGRRTGRRTRSAPGAAVVSSSYVDSMRDAVPNGKNSVVVRTSDLQNIHNSSVILSVAEKKRRQHLREQGQAEKMAAAKARKQRMLQMEEEKKRKAPVMTESEQIKNERDNLLLSHAKQAMDEELDDVKHMNQMMLYAKCATIRDVQLREKQQIQEELAEQERRLDIEMEVERIKNIKMLEERERIRKEEQRVGAQCIIQQIQQREVERTRQQELREQEAAAMIARIKELELKEEQAAAAKVIAGRKMLEQVMEANNAQARAKIRAKQQEVEEDAQIAEYLKAKEHREAEKEREMELLKQEKEKEVARLRAQQERMQDRQSEVDALRAKRYQEANDRAWRKQQVEVAKKKDTMRRTVAEAREMQRREKAQRMAAQALAEREEFQRVLEWNAAQNEADARAATIKHATSNQHREDLLNQISEHEREKAVARKIFLTEGQEITAQMAADKRKLLTVKAQKLALLQAAGVPEKYQAELAKKRVMVSTIQ